MLPLLVSLAWSADCSTPMTTTEARTFVQQARTAVESDDVARFQERYRSFVQRARCLEEAVPKGPWAEMLVLDAIVAFAEGRDASTPLGTAKATDPGVEVPPFLSDKVPPASSPSGPRAPKDVYLDGRPTDVLPALKGDHVLQRRTAAGWETVVADAWPKAWTSGASGQKQPTGPRDPAPTPRAPSNSVVDVFLGGGPGLARSAQHPQEPGDFLPDAKGTGPGLDVSGELQARGGLVGGVARVRIPIWLGQLGVRGARVPLALEGGATYAIGPVLAEAGAALGFSALREGDALTQRLEIQPFLGGRWLHE
ncbi:MAG: hypothetical protein KC656_20280, partial [Myxococcales bacterium]|nr:hypothetical protein [Myxococcales bacterium]